MHCPACGTESDACHRFCSHCGRALRQVCRACKALAPAEAPSCPDCGSELAGREIAPRLGPEGVPRRLETERKHVTVLFADLCGSLALLDEDPEQAKSLLEELLDRMAKPVRSFGGTVNQVMGDGFMAMFGAPLAYEDHAVRACHAAVEMQRTIGAFASRSPMNIVIRVGLNSGEVIVGERGSDFDLQYTAFGRTAHIAARMEQMARPGSVLMTESTWRLAARQVEARRLGPKRIRGLDRPIAVFELLSTRKAGRLDGEPKALLPFVGRQVELGLLQGALKDVLRSRGRVAALVGEPGVGKSRLVAEFVKRSADADWLVLQARGLSHLKPVPFGAVKDLLASWGASRAEADKASPREGLARWLDSRGADLAPHRGALLALAGGKEDRPGSEPPKKVVQQDLASALAALLVAESRSSPVLLTIDDLQWIDADSVALLSQVASALSDAPVLLLVNYRPEYQQEWHKGVSCLQIPLECLRDRSAEAFLDELLGVDGKLGELRRLLIARTGGNPFFMEEVVRGLVAQGALTGPRGAYRLARATPELSVPASVQDMLAMRIDRLAPEDKHLLQTAATIGYEVDVWLLRALSGLGKNALAGHLDRLREAELLLPLAQPGDGRVMFKHALTHEVAYGGLLSKDKRRLHGDIVTLLELQDPDGPDDNAQALAFHAARAEIWEKALGYGLLAGQRALSLSACRQAAASLEDSLAILDRLPPAERSAEVELDLRLCLRNAIMPLGRHDEIPAHLDAAERLATELDAPRRLAQVYSYRSHYHWLVGEWDDAIKNGRIALRMAEELEDFGLAVVTRFILGLAAYSLGSFQDAIAYLGENARSLVGARSSEHFGMFSLPSVVSRGWLAWCEAERGNFAAALPLAEDAREIADATGRPFDRVQGLLAVGGTLVLKGEVKQAVPLLEQAFDLCEEAEIHILMPRVASGLGYAYGLAGRVSDSLRLATQALREAETMHLASIRTLCLRWIGEVKLLAGQAPEAADIAETMVAECRATGEQGHEAWARYLLGTASGRCGDLATAERCFDAAAASARSLGMKLLLAHIHRHHAELSPGSQDEGQGIDHRAAAAALFEEMQMTYWLEQLEAQDSFPATA